MRPLQKRVHFRAELLLHHVLVLQALAAAFNVERASGLEACDGLSYLVSLEAAEGT